MHLPTFIIGGVRRGGSTSLYHAIRQHPDIFLYPHSELNYFVEKEVNGRKWREAQVDPDRWTRIERLRGHAALYPIDVFEVGACTLSGMGTIGCRWRAPVNKRRSRLGL